MSTSPARNQSGSPSRRSFLKKAGTAAVVAAAGPTILRATDKAGSKAPVLGTGAHQYEVVSHSWGELPSHIVWGETHGVTVDEAGLIYVKHRNYAKTPMDSIVVFDPQGKFVRSFGKEFHRGGHGIDLRKEGTKNSFICATYSTASSPRRRSRENTCG